MDIIEVSECRMCPFVSCGWDDDCGIPSCNHPAHSTGYHTINIDEAEKVFGVGNQEHQRWSTREEGFRVDWCPLNADSPTGVYITLAAKPK